LTQIKAHAAACAEHGNMKALSHVMTGHHQHCDELFAVVEAHVRQADWPAAGAAWSRLQDGMDWHFRAEEQRLFPGFESVTGMVHGPTAVMREEHAQLRELLAACADALGAQDAARFAGHADSLLMLLQQHNYKEENVLYPMCESMLTLLAQEFSAQFADEIAAL
jgi:iron-sulfur cluster repair protein YtfE (RIC family)